MFNARVSIKKAQANIRKNQLPILVEKIGRESNSEYLIRIVHARGPGQGASPEQ